MIIIAKRTIGIAYNNAELSLNGNGEFILTEVTKDDIKTFNLSRLIDSLVGNESVSITIKTVDELESEEVDEQAVNDLF